MDGGASRPRARVVLLHDERLVAEALLVVLREGLADVADTELARQGTLVLDCDLLLLPARLWSAAQQAAEVPVLLIGDGAPGRSSTGASVRGWLRADADAAQIRAAVLAVLSGDDWAADSRARPSEGSPPAVRALLTPREREVLALISGGLTTRQMSSRLGVAEATVRTLRQRLFHKLDVHTAAEAVARGTQLDLTSGAVDLVTEGDRARYDDPATPGRPTGR